MEFCEELQFVEIFKMIRGFCLRWIVSCQNRSKATCSLTQNVNFGKSSDKLNLKQLLRKLFLQEFFNFLPSFESIGCTLEAA